MIFLRFEESVCQFRTRTGSDRLFDPVFHFCPRRRSSQNLITASNNFCHAGVLVPFFSQCNISAGNTARRTSLFEFCRCKLCHQIIAGNTVAQNIFPRLHLRSIAAAAEKRLIEVCNIICITGILAFVLILTGLQDIFDQCSSGTAVSGFRNPLVDLAATWRSVQNSITVHNHFRNIRILVTFFCQCNTAACHAVRSTQICEFSVIGKAMHQIVFRNALLINNQPVLNFRTASGSIQENLIQISDIHFITELSVLIFLAVQKSLNSIYRRNAVAADPVMPIF